MGPRPDGRGKSRRRGEVCAQVGRRQWGRGQTAAESCADEGKLHRALRVNGAAARRPRKADQSETATPRSAPASMGPRPDGRGKLPPTELLSPRRRCVNGAAARRPRKAARIPRAPLPTCCVNGAAARRPRKAFRSTAAITCTKSRQWGRGQTAAERISRMSAHMRAWPGVNGAAARRPRKDTRRAPSTPDNRSVNGAAARRPRKGFTTREALAAADARQWGRGQTAAESWRRRLHHRLSTGRQWGRGQTAAERR